MAIKNTLVSSPSATNLFTATTGTEYAITTMIFCNTSPSTDAYLDVWVVPFGEVAGAAANQVLKSVFIPKTETFVMDSEKFILGGQDAIWAQAQPPEASNLINALVSSVVIS